MPVTGVEVLTAGEAGVVRYLEGAGVVGFAIPTALEAAEDHPGRWPLGAWMDEASDDEKAVTVTHEAGVFRVESGPAATFCDDADYGSE